MRLYILSFSTISFRPFVTKAQRPFILFIKKYLFKFYKFFLSALLLLKRAIFLIPWSSDMALVCAALLFLARVDNCEISENLGFIALKSPSENFGFSIIFLDGDIDSFDRLLLLAIVSLFAPRLAAAFTGTGIALLGLDGVEGRVIDGEDGSEALARSHSLLHGTSVGL